ncbi:MAG: hypothetical protein Q9164_006170 [Protoblastenia rupestris]
MVKRPAEESLDVVAAADSPVSKKNRTDGKPSLGDQETDAPAMSNGFHQDFYTRDGGDVLAAIEIEEEKPEETFPPGNDAEDGMERSAYTATSRQEAPLDGYTDLYLDTIDRSVLDFDFEKLCSVTLSNINVYACLVCGKYYQGRGPKSHAYFHALEVGHHVYVNMQTKRVYVLPEGYEVKSKSLEDIKFVVDPRLSKNDVVQLDREAKDAWDLGGKKYRPGTPSYLLHVLM